MKKETVIKLLLLCGACDSTIRYCIYLGVTIDEIEDFRYQILAENEGRLEL